MGDLKKIIAAQIGTRPEKIRLQKWYQIFKDNITLDHYEIHDGMGIELYCILIHTIIISYRYYIHLISLT